jgi:single-strand DNA-binding protein
MINRVILVGNLTRDAEVRGSAGRTATSLRLATDSRWKDAEGQWQERAEFHSVVAFGRLGETMANLAVRGARLYVEGRLQTRDYVNADGVKKYSTDVVAETIRFLSPRPATALPAGAPGVGVELATAG